MSNAQRLNVVCGILMIISVAIVLISGDGPSSYWFAGLALLSAAGYAGAVWWEKRHRAAHDLRARGMVRETFYNSGRYTGVAVGELVTLFFASAPLGGEGGVENQANVVVAASIAVVGSGFWLSLLFCWVIVTSEAVGVRWLRMRWVPLAEVTAVLVDEGFSTPVLVTRDGKEIRLPLVGPFVHFDLGVRKTEWIVRRLADALNVPVRPFG